LADGTVLLYRHLDQALVSAASVTHISRPPPLLPKPKIIYASPEPITGLAFRSPKPSSNQSYFSNPDSSDPDPKPSSTHRHTCLFIVTTAKVLCFFTSGRGAGSGAEPIVMDDLGGSIGCSEMMENGDLILADESALYVYGPEGRGACLAYEGPKARLNSWGNYLVITSPPSTTGLKNELEQTRVIVFDLQNRFIAFNSLFRGTVLHVWAEWGELYVLTSSAEVSHMRVFLLAQNLIVSNTVLLFWKKKKTLQQVTRLVERPLTEKLSILYDKDMYVLATNVAKSSGADPSELSEIYRRFGDYLYQKSDFEGAVQQYINTIGTVQPSIVVRKVSMVFPKFYILRVASDSLCLFLHYSVVVLGCSKDIKPDVLLARIARKRDSQRGPYDPAAQVNSQSFSIFYEGKPEADQDCFEF
jgi:hypothetical protein